MQALRPDERERALARFRLVELKEGERLALPVSAPPSLGLVVDGQLTLRRAELPGLAPVETVLGPGDRWGELAIFAGLRVDVEATARCPSRLALLDPEGFREITREFPVVWLEVSRRLSSELKWKNDLLREIQEFDAWQLGPEALELFLIAKRRRLIRHRVGLMRRAGRYFLRTALVEPAREPAFWILSGFLLAIAISRTVVGAILRFHLEEKAFNLHATEGGHPRHTHHFNYGFTVLVLSGLLAFLPGSRERIRPLALAFGFGLGLVFDEFALIWSLNPNYYAHLSYVAQALMLLLLAQLVWFRRFYGSLLERLKR